MQALLCSSKGNGVSRRQQGRSIPYGNVREFGDAGGPGGRCLFFLSTFLTEIRLSGNGVKLRLKRLVFWGVRCVLNCYWKAEGQTYSHLYPWAERKASFTRRSLEMTKTFGPAQILKLKNALSAFNEHPVTLVNPQKTDGSGAPCFMCNLGSDIRFWKGRNFVKDISQFPSPVQSCLPYTLRNLHL